MEFFTLEARGGNETRGGRINWEDCCDGGEEMKRAWRIAAAVLVLLVVMGMGGDCSEAYGGGEKIPEAAERFGDVHWYEENGG